MSGRKASPLLYDTDPLFADAVARAGIGAWSCDVASGTLSWTPGVYHLFGLSPAERLDRHEIVALYDEESRLRMERLRARAIATGQPFAMEAQIVRHDGERRWMRLTTDVVRKGGRVVRLHGIKQDITEDRHRLETLRRQAEHDALTGLANRSVFETRFLAAPAADPRLGPLAALILIDLDDFKQVNDRLGHMAGDACLRVAAERMTHMFPDAALMARIGGDEFAILIRAGRAPASIRARAEALVAELCRPVPRGEAWVPLGASAGLAFINDPLRCDPEVLFASADAALYAAKAAGRGSLVTRPASSMRADDPASEFPGMPTLG